MRVYKFGGTSVRDAQRVANVSRLVQRESEALLVVTSAPAGVTDLLQSLQNVSNLDATRAALSDIFKPIIQSLTSPDRDRLKAHLEAALARLVVAHNDRDMALVLSFGEVLMSDILAAALRAQGVPAAALDARDMIRTHSTYLSAQVDFEQTRMATTRSVKAVFDKHQVAVIGGFIAADSQGHTTTLGRNGSDYSASIMGACLEADEVWIWTDVDGIYTADPRYHERAELIREISFRESAEAAYFGAKVVHPYTMWPLLDTPTSLRIKNTLDPDQPGTLICHEPRGRGTSLIVTTVPEVAVVTVGGYGLVGVPGVAARVFGAISRSNTNVLLISQSSSEHNISFAVRRQQVPQTLEALNRELADWMGLEHRVDRIRVVDDVAILTVVGENMRGRAGIAGTIFSALGAEGVNVLAIAQGSSEYSISIVVDETQVTGATDAILEVTGGLQ